MPKTFPSPRPRLGFFGGSFDPPHLGHLQLACLALKKANLDKLLQCPAHHAPLRPVPPMFSGEHRLGMIQSICKVNEGLEACDLEVKHGKVRYTYDTILEVMELYPKHDLFLLLGDDQLDRIKDWQEPEKLSKIVHFLVFSRRPNRSDIPPIPNIRLTFMENSLIDLSSTIARGQLRSGKLPFTNLPLEVSNYLQENKLFPLTKKHS